MLMHEMMTPSVFEQTNNGGGCRDGYGYGGSNYQGGYSPNNGNGLGSSGFGDPNNIRYGTAQDTAITANHRGTGRVSQSVAEKEHHADAADTT